MPHQTDQYDLTQAADELEKRGIHPEFVKAVKLALSVASAHQDLEQCREALALLGKMTNSEYNNQMLSNTEAGTLAGALFDNAVILYARATDTDPIDRRKWFGSGKLDRSDRATHANVMRLRNKGIAHFGNAVTVDGATLIAEAIVFDPANLECQIAYRANRVHNRSKFAKDLDQLAAKVASMAQTAAIDRMTALRAALLILSKLDKSLGGLVTAYPLDERLCFTSGSEVGNVDHRAKRTSDTSFITVESD